MKSIVCTYPEFRELPKGLKQMLVLSETLFFDEAFSATENVSNHEILNSRLSLPQKQFTANGHAAFAA
jgi:hypothetical protein